ncbi:helicase-exonuclease AddAB subunit AddB [Lactonifactor longoviformis]|uniref:helicase-exonuclease AddAB subunit AddB n=1 Tax=Lactonifactor longoviformis TaxID=341220 RepID=UPI0036F3AE1A
MPLQFVFGNSGSGKSWTLYHKIIEESMEYPKRQYLILVPEQFTMQTQKDLVAMHPRGGIMNIDVVSFERLAFRVMEEIGEDMGQVLEETGKSLVLRKVAQKKKKELKVLKEQIKKPGYIAQLKSTVSEFTQYHVGPEDMERMLRSVEDKPQLYYKLRDIQILYQGFMDYLRGTYITAEQVLEMLCRVIWKWQRLEECVVVLDGFTGFTPVQYRLLEEIFPRAGKIYAVITLDEKEDPYSPGSPHKLFFMSKQTVHRLLQIARRTRTEVGKEICIHRDEQGRFAHSPALAYLEQNIFRYGSRPYPGKQEEIEIRICRTPQSEMEMAADEIRRLVREQGYRYRDFAVVTGDMEGYASYAAWAFEDAGIPCFLDQKHSVLMNPFIEFIRAAVEIAADNYSYDSVFRFLRCGLTELIPEEVDLLENYVIALGIRGTKRWEEEWIRRYRGQEEGETVRMEAIRSLLMSSLHPFTSTLKKKGLTVREGVTALYQFIVGFRLQEKLKHQEKLFRSAGEYAMVKEYSQIYEIIMELLDKMADVLGEERVTVKEFQELLEAGLQEAKVGVIPPSADQVLVGDIERTRLKDVRVLFFAGVNEGVIPRKESGGGLLSDIDREYLRGSRVELAPTQKENHDNQRFYLYLNMTKPRDRLILSYSRTNGKGESSNPAYLIRSIQHIFPEISPRDMEEETPCLENPVRGLEYLSKGFREAFDREPRDAWKELWSWYLRSPNYRDTAKKLAEAAFYTNPHDHISLSAARALYGTTLENSPTRLERFAACAFAHFLEHGLGLRERIQYQFNAMDMGNVLHTALELFARKLGLLGIGWRDLGEEKRLTLVEESVEEIINDYGNTVLHSSARNEYMIARVKRMMNRTVWALQKQVERGDFVPRRFEVSFSMTDSLKSVNIALSEEEEMKLKGRIDRLDTYEDGNHVYVKVIDYKSGNTSFDLVALYHGLQLQLVLYLNAAVEIEQQEHPGKEVKPAGIFYYNIKDPVVDKVPGESLEDLNERILKNLRVNGLVTGEKEILEKMDQGFAGEPPYISSVVPAAFNKDGSLSRTSAAVNDYQFNILREYVDKKIRDIGTDILKGNVKVSPYQLGQKNPCTYCPYHGVCGFDEKIPGYSFRRLGALPPEELWEKMKEEM